jgi:predicted small integral membrane protein
MSNRLIKTIFGFLLGLYMTIVCFNNLTDYDSNFQFVRMVTGMDDVFSNAKTGWRSIHSETLHHIMYLFIIATELTIAFLTIAGSFKMVGKLKSETAVFNQTKKLLTTGLSLGVALWFGMFITIGGEWFLMWQSKNWNGQNTAFSLSICFLLFLLYIGREDV